MENVIIILENLFAKIDLRTAFVCSCVIVSTLFIQNLFFSIFFREYGAGKRTWFLFVLGGVFAFQKALAEVKNAPTVYADITLSLGLVFAGITFAVRTRRKKQKKDNAELNRFISSAIKCARAQDVTRPVEEFFTQNLKAEGQELPTKISSEKDYGVDFAHVKNVIDKLEYYGLGQSEKRQVSELNNAIYEAENYGFSPLVKSKINDGLGALLKIMSKHGV